MARSRVRITGLGSIAETHCIIEQSRTSLNVEWHLNSLWPLSKQVILVNGSLLHPLMMRECEQSVFRRGFVFLTAILRRIPFILLLE